MKFSISSRNCCNHSFLWYVWTCGTMESMHLQLGTSSWAPPAGTGRCQSRSIHERSDPQPRRHQALFFISGHCRIAALQRVSLCLPIPITASVASSTATMAPSPSIDRRVRHKSAQASLTTPPQISPSDGLSGVGFKALSAASAVKAGVTMKGISGCAKSATSRIGAGFTITRRMRCRWVVFQALPARGT